MTVPPDVITGSHEIVVEARALSTFQSGADPDGVEVGVIGGDVVLDGTAKVRGTANVTVQGVTVQDGPSAFPRGRDLTLAPFGQEVFLRHGILGAGENGAPLWTELGYFRFEDTDQQSAPYGGIRLACFDRMQAIVEAEFTQPRVFAAGRTVESIFDELVGDVFPGAMITFDDNLGLSTLGRQLIAEKSRWGVLNELATALGKIMFWNRVGELRIETAPDESVIAWEVNARHDGVLAGVARRVSRTPIKNGWVVTGEGGDTLSPVRGTAVDADPNSPTYWFGANNQGTVFGQKPRRYSSPFITLESQAVNAAREGLRRTLGAPFSLSYTAIPNPKLEPFQTTAVTQQDWNRDVHVALALRIPLTSGPPMRVNTRDQVVPLIGGI